MSKAIQKQKETKKNLRQTRPVPTVEEISDRAYYQWLKRGCTHGFHVEDWLNAEYELLNSQDILEDNSDER